MDGILHILIYDLFLLAVPQQPIFPRSATFLSRSVVEPAGNVTYSKYELQISRLTLMAMDRIRTIPIGKCYDTFKTTTTKKENLIQSYPTIRLLCMITMGLKPLTLFF